MRNPLKERVIRVMLSVVDSLESLNEESLQAKDVRPQIHHLLSKWPDSPNGSEEELTRAALVYWIDDLLSHADWPGASQWRSDPLEHEILGTGHGAWRFFASAETARYLGYVNALEVFAACTQLGFRGVYRKRDSRRQLQAQPAALARSTMSCTSSVTGNSETREHDGIATSTQVATAPVQTVVSSDPGQDDASCYEWPPRKSRDEVFAELPPTIDTWAAAVFRELPGDVDLANITLPSSWKSSLLGLPKLLVTLTAMIAIVGTLCCLVW
ncbi:DotU family type IV/VI secretion system protein [Thalassoroseus pseudoceratinae]|uniref:DotU family type IV/VI secretion system protein n=1 Tax=Thalassoroseus pseudoceratinae TaxID=2713176 RepID=UPI00141E4CDE|nr:DotU family type IV/VI secretion system protein [Thalassoroseus pseudoceratinae]